MLEGDMKRSELYTKVWSTPMIKLAVELGISDVGLAKACRRHAVPVPPRGYWAKLRAGQKTDQRPLPTPELDVVVHFATSDPDERARQKAMERKRLEVLNAQATTAMTTVSVKFADSLDDAHPLVKATQRYCDRIPKLVEQYKRRGVNAWRMTKPEDRPPSDRYHRYSLLHLGLLNITASLDSMDWVLRFHSTILNGLVAGGMTIAWREATPERKGGQQDGPAVEARFRGEVFKIEFSQGYRRVSLDAAEVAKKKKEDPWTREFEYRASEKLTFSILGTEYGARKTWLGTQEKLQGLVEEIVKTAFQLVPMQVELRKQREAAAIVSERAAEVRALAQRRANAKAEQLKQAFLMAEADARVRQLHEFLAQLEQSSDELAPHYGARAKVWIDMVRQELAAKNPVEEMLQRCLSVPSWSTWPPDWWPPDENMADSRNTDA
jgi:hypothetical protein